MVNDELMIKDELPWSPYPLIANNGSQLQRNPIKNSCKTKWSMFAETPKLPGGQNALDNVLQWPKIFVLSAPVIITS